MPNLASDSLSHYMSVFEMIDGLPMLPLGWGREMDFFQAGSFYHPGLRFA